MKTIRILISSIFISVLLLPLFGFPIDRSFLQVAQNKESLLGKNVPEVEYLNQPGVNQSLFSQAVRVGNVLILSGQLGINPKTGKLAEGGIEGETKQCLENIKSILERFGSSLDKVIKATVMLADISEWGKMNSVYATYFIKTKPARTAFAVSSLAGGARVEIECWAIADQESTK